MALDSFGLAWVYREGTMTQRITHQGNVGTPIQSMACMTMAQPVRRDTAGNPGPDGGSLYNAMDLRFIQVPGTFAADEYRLIIAGPVAQRL